MKTPSIVLLVSAIVLASCSSEHKSTTLDVTPISVTTAKVAPSDPIKTVRASGRLEASQSANLSTRLMGHIADFKVTVGQKVTKGQLLVEVSPTDMEAKRAQAIAGLAGAEAAFENAEKDFYRFTSLFEKQSASQKELDNMTTRYQMAKSGLEMAQNALKEVEAHLTYAFIRAPFSGVVVNTFGKSGDMAFPGMPLVTVESTVTSEIVASISESDVASLTIGDKAEVTVSSANVQLTATLKELSRSSKNTGGQYLAKLTIDEPSEQLYSGMFASLSFQTTPIGESESVWVPSDVIIRKGQLSGIYVVAGDKALLRWVRLGETSEGKVQILSGLRPGETYIATSKAELVDGATLAL